ncbi:hypothetical protein ACP4OV_029548 [Aristida adscensionis]
MAKSVQDIPDKLLEVILLHLTSPPCIIRAAATCRRWPRIVTSLRFRSHLCCRLEPHITGSYHQPQLAPSDGRPTFVPSSPATGIHRRHFSLDFLPSGGGKSWKLADSSRSLLLLAKKGGWMRRCFPDLVVCEPLTRRHRLIPRPDEEMRHHECLGIFLSAYSSNDDMSGFSVTCVLYESCTRFSGEIGTVRACVFSRRRRGIWRWTAGRSAAMDGLRLNLQGKDSLQFAGRAGGSSFWWIEDERPLRRLVCASGTGFSLVNLPEHIQRLCTGTSAFRIIGGGDGKVRIACLAGENLSVFARDYLMGVGYEWELEKHLNLRTATCGLPGSKEEYFRDSPAKIVAVSGRCLVLTPDGENWYFSVELETGRVEALHVGSRRTAVAFPYELPWPPRFQACLCTCRRRGQGPCCEICAC